ncbi:MAG: carboxypeptidase-like regulatory domain-containing protein, partial [Acidobacteriota bacterium]
MMTIVRNCVFCALAFLLFSLSAAAQQPSGSLNGTVVDPNGAVIPGSSVTAINKATNASRTALTNQEGQYTIANLPVGTYEMSFTANGFKKLVVASVVVSVGQSVTINGPMQVGDLVTTVDGPDSILSAMVDSESSKVDAVINNKTIDNLPLNGRNFLELALLTPGNTLAPNFDPTKTNTVVISSAGQVGRGGNVMIDGTDNNDDVVGGALINVSQDAVQEFQVATNRFSAEFGRSASSVINVVTKSGTNATHGSASFFERDRRLQELPATLSPSVDTLPFGRQQYSFTLGGPIKKDKVFGFSAAEYRDQDGAVVVGVRNTANRTITNGFAPAPLRDLLLNSRIDINASDKDSLNFRYSFEDVDATD